jgi:hypothetical protein
MLAPLALSAVVQADDGAQHQARQDRPIVLGTSGGSILDQDGAFCCGGTLGALVQDGDGVQHVLSNNHILARTNRASLGEDVVQPGRIDVGCAQVSADVVADLSAYVPISFTADNQVDAAMAQVRAGAVSANGAILDVGVPSATPLAPSVGLGVKKSGRTTGLTTGTITATDVTVTIGYTKKCSPGGRTMAARFINQFRVDSGAFSGDGDSGSLIVENVPTEARPVGLLFAGSSNSTLANPVAAVLSALDVTMVGSAPVACAVDAECDDLNACTTDACASGFCAHVPIDCDDGDVCTADTCAGGICSHAPASCDDGNACTTDSCDSVTGCAHAPIEGCSANAIVDCITYTTSGGKTQTKNLNITVAIVDDGSTPVASASVSISLYRSGAFVGSGTGSTDASGRITFTLSNAGSGCYFTDVTSVVAGGLTFDGSEPANGFSKGVDATPDADCRSGNDACGTSSGAVVSGAPPSSQAMARVRAVKRQHEGKLLDMAGVVGAGIGRSRSGEPVIEVYLDADESAKKAQIPNQLDGVPVRVVVTGPFTAF